MYDILYKLMSNKKTKTAKNNSELDRKNRQPLYEQLKDILLSDIRQRKSGEMLPTEKELCEQYGLSRQTVRHTLKELSEKGYLIRTAGRGTIVAAHPKITRDNSWALENYNLEMRQHGIEPETKVISLCVIPGSAFVSEKLGLTKDEPVIFLRRLRFTDGWPYVVADSYLPYNKLAGLELEEKALTQESLHVLIEKKFHYTFVNANRSIEALPAPAQEARDLGILPGSPVLYSETTWRVSANFVMEFVMEWYRGDRSRFTMRLGKENITNDDNKTSAL